MYLLRKGMLVSHSNSSPFTNIFAVREAHTAPINPPAGAVY